VDIPISRFPVPDPATLPEDMRQLIETTAKKTGFVPNVFLALAHRPAAAGIALAVFVAAIFAFMPVDKSTFTGTKVEAVTIRYEFSDNLNYRQVEKYVTRIEDWMQARKDSLHLKSTYSWFSNNDAITRAYLKDGRVKLEIGLAREA